MSVEAAVMRGAVADPPGELPGLRVALLSPCSWPEVRRGAERMFRDLAAGLLARGHRPRLITSHPGRPSFRVEDGLEVVRNWRPPAGRLRRRAFEDHLTHVPFSYRTLARGSDDVAHASHAPDAVACARWSQRTGRPAVFSYMGIPTREFLVSRRLRLDLTLRAIDGCGAVVALSQHAADEFARTLGVAARVIHPGVDLAHFTPGGRRAELPTIACTSPPEVPEKRVGLLVDAFAIVRRERPTARLVLQRPADGSLAATLRAQAGVELVPPDPELLRGIYRSAWVAALPSSSDAFGLVLTEALACGTPVLGSDRGAIPEVVNSEKIGRIFTGEDPGQVARALLEALELSTDAATPAECRRRAEDFSIERCAGAYETLYRELLASVPAGALGHA